MSDPNPNVTVTSASPPRNTLMRYVILLAGVAAIILGVRQFRAGMDEIRMDPEVERLTKECDSAFHKANENLRDAAPLLQSVLQAVDNQGLEAVRKARRADVDKALGLYTSATSNLREAAQKAEDAAAKKPGEKMEQFLKTRAEACRGYAASRDLSADVARMVLDEKILTTAELAQKVTEKMEQANKLEEAANAKVKEADNIVESFKK